jgi:hypothetical protein
LLQVLLRQQQLWMIYNLNEMVLQQRLSLSGGR